MRLFLFACLLALAAATLVSHGNEFATFVVPKHGTPCLGACSIDANSAACFKCCTTVKHEVDWKCDTPDAAGCCDEDNWDRSCWDYNSEENFNHACGQCNEVDGVSTTALDGIYTTGQVISIIVDFGYPVVVTGTPQLILGTNPIEVADYVGGNDTQFLTFNYTVRAGDTATRLDYNDSNALDLNGGSISSCSDDQCSGTFDFPLNLADPGQTGSLSATSDIQIAAGTGVVRVTATVSNGTYTTDDTISIAVTFLSTVFVTGTPELLLATGSTDQYATYVDGNNSDTLIFNYTVQAGDSAAPLNYVDTDSLVLNGGTITYASGTAANLTLPLLDSSDSLGGSSNITIDTSSPTPTPTTPTPTTPTPTTPTPTTPTPTTPTPTTPTPSSIVTGTVITINFATSELCSDIESGSAYSQIETIVQNAVGSTVTMTDHVCQRFSNGTTFVTLDFSATGDAPSETTTRDIISDIDNNVSDVTVTSIEVDGTVINDSNPLVSSLVLFLGVMISVVARLE